MMPHLFPLCVFVMDDVFNIFKNLVDSSVIWSSHFFSFFSFYQNYFVYEPMRLSLLFISVKNCSNNNVCFNPTLTMACFSFLGGKICLPNSYWHFNKSWSWRACSSIYFYIRGPVFDSPSHNIACIKGVEDYSRYCWVNGPKKICMFV